MQLIKQKSRLSRAALAIDNELLSWSPQSVRKLIVDFLAGDKINLRLCRSRENIVDAIGMLHLPICLP